MSTATAINDYSLTMSRTFKSAKKDVYEAWTSKEALTKWFAPAAEFTTVIHQQELKVGGNYRLEMIEPSGASHVIHGEYVALNPHDQLAFTWEWESDEDQVNSLVTIDLSDSAKGTDMVLTHEKLASQHMVDIHSEGWTGCLMQLTQFIK